MNNLTVALNAIVPLFLLITVGVFLKQCRIVTDQALPQINNMIFRVFLPMMLFYSVYQTSLDQMRGVNLFWFMGCGVIGVFTIAVLVIPRIEKEPAKRGAMIQAMFRSNFLILGLPIVISLFGQENAGGAAVAVAVFVPLFNALAVTTLEIYRGGRPDLRKIIIGIAKNPLIWASILGLLFLFLGVRLPTVLEVPAGSLSAIASPLALVCLGASLHFDQIRGNRRNLIICVAGRLIIVPGIIIPMAIAFGFRGVDLGIMMALFASPAAVTSFVMAQQMGSDGELAGQVVVFTSLVSGVTLFLWTFLLKEFGYM